MEILPPLSLPLAGRKIEIDEIMHEKVMWNHVLFPFSHPVFFFTSKEED